MGAFRRLYKVFIVYTTILNGNTKPNWDFKKRSGENRMEKLFKLKQNGTTVRTELLAGLTTFMTMAYIIALNPNLLTSFDVGSALWNGVFLSTCIASAIGIFVMAFAANKPFAMHWVWV